MTERRDDELIELTLQGLERRTVDADLNERLAAARRLAVERVDRPVPVALGNWIPAGAMAFTLLAVGVLATQLGRDTPPELTDELFAAQHLELLEDIELYAWMVELDGADEGSG